MLPVSRPMICVPGGRRYCPASVPSARSAVRTTFPPTSEAAVGAAPLAAAAGAPPRRKPHEPQKRLPVPLMWLHCGQTTAALPDGGATLGGWEVATLGDCCTCGGGCCVTAGGWYTGTGGAIAT